MTHKNYKNAVILAAGTSSRFFPLSLERPKGLLSVKGEILIERQIRQLKEAGINDITIVVGYMLDRFKYLEEKYGVNLVVNEDYNKYNNISSIIRVLNKLGNTYVCSADNYFPENVFIENSSESYYSALYSIGPTSEYCIYFDDKDNIIDVKVGGSDCWYMVGHVFLSEQFSKKFVKILKKSYANEESRSKYWEDIYIANIQSLPKLKIHKYGPHQIEEFDTLEELRKFDSNYENNTQSMLIKNLAQRLNCEESSLSHFYNLSKNEKELCFSFRMKDKIYLYNSKTDSITEP